MRIGCFLAGFLIGFFADTNSHPRKIQISGLAQGTTYHITYYATDSLVTQYQLDSILTQIDNSLSLYKPYSLISRFNASDDGIMMDDHFRRVLNKSIEAYQATKGLFDITVQPLVQAWGFGTGNADTLPGDAVIAALKSCTGTKWLIVSDNSLIKKKPCVRLDMNGIAQGYSVDVLADFLENHAIRDYLVELGGEIRIRGRKQPGSEKMIIGIESPSTGEFGEEMQEKKIAIDAGAVTTSGNYRQYHESGGRKIAHLIDPLTGYPVRNELLSVTVYAREAITADAYDNALMLMGLPGALQFVEKRKDIEAYFIYQKANGVIADTASPGFYRLLNH